MFSPDYQCLMAGYPSLPRPLRSLAIQAPPRIRRKWPSHVRTPERRSSNGLLWPRHDCRQEPFGHHAEGLFRFNSSIPASSPGVAPSSKSCCPGQVFFGQRCNWLPPLGVWRFKRSLTSLWPAAYYQFNLVRESQVIRHARQGHASGVKRGKEGYDA